MVISTSMLEQLIAYSRQDDRVCPTPQRWDDLWKMLPGVHRVGNGWEPAPPLILGAWHDTSAISKMLRLEEHIRYADTHGVLPTVDAFLRNLPEADWAHLGDF